MLLQVVFHARVAAERADGYTINDVADGIVTKLVRRHPHVFADVTVSGADEVHRNWDDIKRAERAEKRNGPNGPECPPAPTGSPSSLDGVPFGQPALALAAQLQRRAARAGVPDKLARLEGDPGSGSGRTRRPGGRDRPRIVPSGPEGPGDGPRSRDATARRGAPLPRSGTGLGAVLIRRILF